VLKDRQDKQASEYHNLMELRERMKELHILVDKKANLQEINKLISQIEEVKGSTLKLDSDLEVLRQMNTRVRYDISDLEDNMHAQINVVDKKILE